MILKRLTQILTLIGLFYRTLSAQEIPVESQPDFHFEELNFRKLEVLENSSVGNVYKIEQDSRGFIWFASSQGAYRFDGYRLKSFQHEIGNPKSIGHNSVFSIHLDSKKQLWFGTQDGISLYDPVTESFRNYPSENEKSHNLSGKVNTVTHDSLGRIVATTETGFLHRYDEASDSFITLNSVPFGYIKSMVCDPKDIFWVGFEDGVIRYDHEKRQSRHFPDNNTSPGVANNFVNAIHYFSEENIWIGRSSNGIARLNAKTGSVELIAPVEVGNQYITDIKHYPGTGVVVTSNSSITLYDTNGTKLRQITSETRNGSIPITGMNTFYSDSFGNQWIASNFDALNISSNRKPFKKFPEKDRNPDANTDNPVTAFIEDSQGNFWIGNGKSGLDLYPADGGEPVRFRHDPNDPSSIVLQPILKIFEDSHGDIWLGSFRGGLQKYLRETNSFKTYLANTSDPHSIGGQDIRDFAEDENGNIWINTHGNGIDYFDVQTQQFTHLQSSFSAGAPTLIDNWVYCLLYDNENNLWIGTTQGISILNTRDGTITNHRSEPGNEKSLTNSFVKDLYQDSKGRVWIGTEDGLNLYNKVTNDFTAISVASGLPNQSIRSIIEDDQGNIWIGTSDGLAKFNPDTLEIMSYFVEDGLASDEYFEGSVFKDKNGVLYFGQNRGITKFDPSSIRDNKTPPDVFITDILVFNSSLPIVPDSQEPGTLRKSILDTSRVSLRYDQKAISLEFIGLHYIQSNKTQYSYKLEGFDPDWSTPSSKRAVTYTNLNPGTYQFRVKASNNDGVWNEQGASLTIAILPPFWKTTWFIALAIATGLAIPSIFVFWRLSAIKSKKRDLEIAVEQRTEELQNAHKELETAYKHILSYHDGLEQTVKLRTQELQVAKSAAEQSDRLKSAFLANMSHEIRTPMNAIVGFLHFLESEDLSKDERTRMSRMINESSNTLLTLIDDILDLSTIEAGEAEIVNAPVNIQEACENLYLVFKDSPQKSKSTTLVFDAHPSSARNGYVADFGEIDPVRLKQILSNLIVNALKFTESGEVRFGYKFVSSQQGEKPDKLVFTVKDTGIGIPEEELENIFNRFHKLERQSEKIYRGTGLGLTISRKLVDLMDGTIEVTSKVNVGTEFTITFPYVPVNQTIKAKERKPSSFSSINSIQNFEKYTLLVAEDEKPNFEYIRRALRHTNINVVHAMDGQEALEIYAKQDIDIVLLDLKMPVVDGYEVAKRIRNSNPNIPIIAQSAYAMKGDKERSIDTGADAYITKPFTPDELVQTIGFYLKKISKQESA